MQRRLSDLQSKALLPAVAIRGTTRSDGYSYRAMIPLEKSVPKVIAKTSLQYKAVLGQTMFNVRGIPACTPKKNV